MEDRCIMCGNIIPEGSWLCPLCDGTIDTRDNSQSTRYQSSPCIHTTNSDREQAGD